MNKRVFLSVLLVALFVIGCNDNTEQLHENDNPVQEEVFQDITEEKTQEQELPVTVKPEPESEPESEPELDPDLEPELVIEHIEVTGISLTTYDVTLYIGHKTMPIVTMSPANATNKGEIWQSSDTSVATVDNKGVIRLLYNVGETQFSNMYRRYHVFRCQKSRCRDSCVILPYFISIRIRRRQTHDNEKDESPYQSDGLYRCRSNAIYYSAL